MRGPLVQNLSAPSLGGEEGELSFPAWRRRQRPLSKSSIMPSYPSRSAIAPFRTSCSSSSSRTTWYWRDMMRASFLFCPSRREWTSGVSGGVERSPHQPDYGGYGWDQNVLLHRAVHQLRGGCRVVRGEGPLILICCGHFLVTYLQVDRWASHSLCHDGVSVPCLRRILQGVPVSFNFLWAGRLLYLALQRALNCLWGDNGFRRGWDLFHFEGALGRLCSEDSFCCGILLWAGRLLYLALQRALSRLWDDDCFRHGWDLFHFEGALRRLSSEDSFCRGIFLWAGRLLYLALQRALSRLRGDDGYRRGWGTLCPSLLQELALRGFG